MASTQIRRIFFTNCLLNGGHLKHLKTGVRCYSSKKTIGFVGVGNMGRPMSQNLLKNDHPVVVYDVLDEAMEQCKHDGAKTASSPAELASKSDVVITMLPTNQHVLDCYQGPSGIFEGAKKDTIFIDSSTVDPSVSITISKGALERRTSFVDAPVSGGGYRIKQHCLTNDKEFKKVCVLASLNYKDVTHRYVILHNIGRFRLSAKTSGYRE
ncbi:hypothetical protein RUM44_006428 [Polyplax serrata]|uniref:3-hydroxyisobutyrate dehydrogenase n=1 Tax=Polyplax serrata TaxID=468196 RepID=A0ABR1AI48_POLSC